MQSQALYGEMSIAQAKIPCSGLCRCVGCRNLPDKPENKSLMHLADAAGTLLLLCVCALGTLQDFLQTYGPSSRPQPPPTSWRPWTSHLNLSPSRDKGCSSLNGRSMKILTSLTLTDCHSLSSIRRFPKQLAFVCWKRQVMS